MLWVSKNTTDNVAFIDAGDLGNTLSHPQYSNNHCGLSFHFGPSPLQGATVIDGSADYAEVDLTTGAKPSKTQYLWANIMG